MTRFVVILLGLLVMLTGCGFKPAELPLPGTYVEGESYSIAIEFSSVLNLPAKANVVLSGVEVGILDNVSLTGRSAVATVDIESDVRLPVDTTAELRQNTVLGEIFVSLQLPEKPDGRFLGDGDVIPLEQTRPPDNVEDMLRGLSNVLVGGRVADLAQTVAEINGAFPESSEFERIYGAGQRALDDLAGNTDDIDGILRSAAVISNDLAAKKGGVDRMLVSGPGRAAGLSDVLFGVVDLILALGMHLTPHAGDLLVPVEGDIMDVLRVGEPALREVAQSDITVTMNVEQVNQLLRAKLIPFFNAPPNVRVQEVTPKGAAADPVALADDLIRILRSIGIVR